LEAAGRRLSRESGGGGARPACHGRRRWLIRESPTRRTTTREAAEPSGNLKIWLNHPPGGPRYPPFWPDALLRTIPARICVSRRPGGTDGAVRRRPIRIRP